MKEPLCWTPRQIARTPIPQLWALLAEEVGGEDAETFLDFESFKDRVNELRALKGLPPIAEWL